MGGPYEPFGDDRVALIVDLKPTIVHEPRPGPLDDPPAGEDLEAVVVDPVDDLGGDVMGTAGGDERSLEAGVTPDLGQTRRTAPRSLDDSDPPGVVRHAGGHHQ